MTKIPYPESELIMGKFLENIKQSVRENKANIIIEYFELEIDELVFERCYCGYLQTEDQMEAILFDITTQRYFYIETEIIPTLDNKAVPHLFVLDSKISSLVPKQLQDKMIAVIQTRETEKVTIEDFGTKFRLYKP